MVGDDDVDKLLTLVSVAEVESAQSEDTREGESCCARSYHELAESGLTDGDFRARTSLLNTRLAYPAALEHLYVVYADERGSLRVDSDAGERRDVPNRHFGTVGRDDSNRHTGFGRVLDGDSTARCVKDQRIARRAGLELASESRVHFALKGPELK